MNVRLLFSGELKDLSQTGLQEHARKALQEAWANGCADGEPAAVGRHGLYVIFCDKKIAGFWLIFGSEYLDGGMIGAPHLAPPMAKPLLVAFIEELWWEDNGQKVFRSKGAATPGKHSRNEWTPLIVFEWPHALAGRSGAPPPGAPVKTATRQSGRRVSAPTWRPTGLPEMEPGRSVGSADESASQVPQPASLITVIRGTLWAEGARASGSFDVVSPEVLVGNSTSEDAADVAWLDVALTGGFEQQDIGKPRERMEQRPEDVPLQLPDTRVGYARGGWLTRSLTLWPHRFEDIRREALVERSIGAPWVAQLSRVLWSVDAAIVLVGLITGALQWAETPKLESKAQPPPIASQPAISLCSFDNQKFVDEVRAQIQFRLKRGEDVDDLSDDLQPAWCGLRHRSREDGAVDPMNPMDSEAYSAVAQACFQVLQLPDLLKPGRQEDGVDVEGDVEKILQNIPSLATVLRDFDAICKRYDADIQDRIEGGVFATLVGASPGAGQASRLRSELVRRIRDQRKNGRSSDDCFDKGVTEGVGPSEGLASVCGVDRMESEGGDQSQVAWGKLMRKAVGGGYDAVEGNKKEQDDVIARYVRARFGDVDRAMHVADPLWQCHGALTLAGEGASPLPEFKADWSVTLRPLKGYVIDGDGQAPSQLTLDAALSHVASQATGGIEGDSNRACWAVVSGVLAGVYRPIHPLFKDLDADGWPAAEQQLCGQVCAGAYGIRQLVDPAAWLTPTLDREACLSGAPSAQPQGGQSVGTDTLDGAESEYGHITSAGRLALPWNAAVATATNGRRQVGQQLAQPAQLCAFHLIAQGYFGDGFIPNDYPPAIWAGEVGRGVAYAGGENGVAAQAAKGMVGEGIGSSQSSNRCAQVALQCFTTILLETKGALETEEGSARAIEFRPTVQWVQDWKNGVKGQVGASVEPGTRSVNEGVGRKSVDPWCARVQSFLLESIPEDNLTATCRSGVEVAREHVEGALTDLLRSDASKEAR